MNGEQKRGSDWPINIAIVLSGVSALVTVFIVTRQHHADFPSEDEIIAFLLFLPNLFIAVCCLIYSLTKLADKQRRGRALVVLLFSLVMPIRGGYEAYYPKVKRDDDRYIAYQQKISDWRSLGTAVNPLLRKYYLANKSKCQFLHNDNEAEIEGFAEYAQSQGITLKKGKIVDPWGNPVHFVIAHDGDKALRARGSFFGIADQVSDQIAVGLILDDTSHVQTALCEQWALHNGYIPIRPNGFDK
jgi:hypothetical protein